VYFEGQRIDNLRENDMVAVRTKMGFLFQMSALFDSMTVEDNVCFPLVHHTDLSEPQRRETCIKVLRMVGLDGVQGKMPAELSGGQRKRVALARAIILEPRLILYDEPTTGLDPIRSDVINELILALHRRLGITSIVVTHDIASAFKVADRLVMLNDGKIMADGDPRSFRQSGNDLVQRFIHGMADEEDLARIREGLAVDTPGGKVSEDVKDAK
jgi:phospholipid/cholesterol/gamma-HCH transport system ATP-binding protein